MTLGITACIKVYRPSPEVIMGTKRRIWELPRRITSIRIHLWRTPRAPILERQMRYLVWTHHRPHLLLQLLLFLRRLFLLRRLLLRHPLILFLPRLLLWMELMRLRVGLRMGSRMNLLYITYPTIAPSLLRVRILLLQM